MLSKVYREVLTASSDGCASAEIGYKGRITALLILKGSAMTWVYLMSGGLVLFVFVYLVVALFCPEKF